jgi:hypothetical protein
MPEGITALTNLTSLNLRAPFSCFGALPPGFGALPLVSLTLWHASLMDPGAAQELEGLTGLEVNAHPCRLWRHSCFAAARCGRQHDFAVRLRA